MSRRARAPARRRAAMRGLASPPFSTGKKRKAGSAGRRIGRRKGRCRCWGWRRRPEACRGGARAIGEMLCRPTSKKGGGERGRNRETVPLARAAGSLNTRARAAGDDQKGRGRSSTCARRGRGGSMTPGEGRAAGGDEGGWVGEGGGATGEPFAKGRPVFGGWWVVGGQGVTRKWVALVLKGSSIKKKRLGCVLVCDGERWRGEGRRAGVKRRGGASRRLAARSSRCFVAPARVMAPIA